MTSPYHFRPMTADDLPLTRRWFAQPHVNEWWRDHEDFEFVSGDLSHPDMAQFIVHLDARPFAYLQCYRMSDWDACFEPQPIGTRGIDQFIGEAELLSRGHGSSFIRRFIESLPNDVPRVIVDPRPDNPRAIRAYEKAGFVRDRVVVSPDGPALLMVCER